MSTWPAQRPNMDEMVLALLAAQAGVLAARIHHDAS
jgi:hypothetical protein